MAIGYSSHQMSGEANILKESQFFADFRLAPHFIIEKRSVPPQMSKKTQKNPNMYLHLGVLYLLLYVYND